MREQVIFLPNKRLPFKGTPTSMLVNRMHRFQSPRFSAQRAVNAGLQNVARCTKTPCTDAHHIPRHNENKWVAVSVTTSKKADNQFHDIVTCSPGFFTVITSWSCSL